jgi:galactoside O-acetyltransferase
MIWPQAKIVDPERISIGDSVIIDDFVLLFGGRRTVIGSFVHIAAFTSIAGGGEFIMEDFAGISAGCRVYTGNDDYLGASLTGPTVPAPFRKVERSLVRIGKHAIIGANTVILPGVTIGEGVAVGACSLVNRDLESWKIYVGSPCRVVKARPRDEVARLEGELRASLYDSSGRYIPRDRLRK